MGKRTGGGAIALTWLWAICAWLERRPRSDLGVARASWVAIATQMFLFAESQGGDCYPGSRWLVERTGIKRATACRIRDAMVARGWLLDTGARARGGATIYRLAVPHTEEELTRG